MKWLWRLSAVGAGFACPETLSKLFWAGKPRPYGGYTSCFYKIFSFLFILKFLYPYVAIRFPACFFIIALVIFFPFPKLFGRTQFCVYPMSFGTE